MTAIKSQCPQQSKKPSKKRLIAVALAAILSMSVIGIWLYSVKDPSHVISLLGAAYSFLCTGFFVAQILAFVKAHTDYDQSIEQPKFDILTLEDEWAAS